LYFSELTNKPVVIDSRRHWQSITNIEMYASLFGELPKIICQVRDVEEIMASFASLFKKNNIEWNRSAMNGNLFDNNYLQLKNSFESKYKDCFMFIKYKDLSTNPIKILKRIYKFIGEDFYDHNFDTVNKDDSHKKAEKLLGLNGLHNVKKGIVKSKTNPNKYFSKQQIESFAEMSFWNENHDGMGLNRWL
jgi:sulfotransferase